MVKERQRAEGRRKGYKKGEQEQRGYKVDGERKVGAGAFQVYEPRPRCRRTGSGPAGRLGEEDHPAQTSGFWSDYDNALYVQICQDNT